MIIEENSPIRTQDTRTVITAVYNNPIGVDVTLEFIIKEFSTLQQQYGVYFRYEKKNILKYFQTRRT